jgi:site-specific DNA-methyltransferase (adenine-specific)
VYDSNAEKQAAYRARKRNAPEAANVTLSPSPLQLYRDLGRVRLYHGDARDLGALAAGSVQLVVTSPPYWNARAYSTWPTYDAYLVDMAAAWRECFRVLCDGGRIAVNVPDGYGRPSSGGYKMIGADTARALEAAGFALRGSIVWDKRPAERNSTAWGTFGKADNPSLRDAHEMIYLAHKGRAGRKGTVKIDGKLFMDLVSSIWTVKPAARSWHPAPMPAELARRLITLLSPCPRDTVLDPFLGSGTTVFEAARLGLLGLGVERRLDYLAEVAAAAPAILAGQSVGK